MSLDNMVNNMIKEYVIVPDAHLGDEMSREYKVVKKFIRDRKPDGAILLGDFYDGGALSHWDKDKKRTMENKRYKKEIDKINTELDFLQAYTDDIVYLEGNHEHWVDQYVERHPEVEGMVELPTVLNLDERGIDWIKMNDLYKLGDHKFTHGLYTNKYHAAKHLQTLGCNIVYGHTHNFQQMSMNMSEQDTMTATGLGCLCDKKPAYMKNKPTNWQNQFAVYYLDDKTNKGTIYPITINKGKFIFNGEMYK